MSRVDILLSARLGLSLQYKVFVRVEWVTVCVCVCVCAGYRGHGGIESAKIRATKASDHQNQPSQPPPSKDPFSIQHLQRLFALRGGHK